MKFSVAKMILILIYVSQIMSLKYSDKPGFTDFFKVPGFGKDNEKSAFEPRFKSVNRFLREGEEPKPNNVKLNNSKKVNNQKNNSKNNSTAISVVDLNSPEAVLNAWATISSDSFLNEAKFPTIMQDAIGQSIELRGLLRVNQFWKEDKSAGIPSDETFWFVLRGQYMYYFASKNDLNALGSFYVKSFSDKRHNFSSLSGTEDSCIEVISKSDASYTVCYETRQTKLSWLCSLQKFQDLKQEIECMPETGASDFEYKQQEIVEVKDVQPIVIIPTGSRSCNDKWNYGLRGADWECICKEGLRQSPIDLPPKEVADLTPIHHFFDYGYINSVVNFEIVGGFLKRDDKVKISYLKGAVRIIHPDLGKIVDDEGGVFKAEEINFHTPSEHTINGKRFDLEMQVIHYGRSEGDIAKQIVVSFLFKKTPGIYNKLFDNLNFIDLPNPLEPEKTLDKDFSIFEVFDQPDEKFTHEHRYFSYYQYDGSLTFPPCTERTQNFVIADPIPLSSTVIQLFQEALMKPDAMGENQILVQNRNSGLENIREIQPLNKRLVSIYDNKKFGCVNYESKPKKPKGHWEKRSIEVPHFIYVNSKDPSGIKNSKVIEDEKEALKLIN